MYIMWTAQGHAFLFEGTIEAAHELARHLKHQYGMQITTIAPYIDPHGSPAVVNAGSSLSTELKSKRYYYRKGGGQK